MYLSTICIAGGCEKSNNAQQQTSYGTPTDCVLVPSLNGP